MTDRASPHSIDAEQALLGGLIVDPDRADDIAHLVTAADFYRPDHARLFMLLSDMRAAGDFVDLVTVSDRLVRGDRPEQYGGLSYVLALPDKVPSTANLPHYARIVADKALARRTLRVLDETREALLDGTEHPAVLTARVASELGAAAVVVSDDLEWFDESANEAMADAGRAAQEDATVPGVDNPIAGWAEYVPFFQRGELHVIAARPAVGKSALARKVVEHAAEYGEGMNEAVGLFSLEMKASQVAALTMSHYAHVPLTDIRAGLRDQEAWGRLHDAHAMALRLPIMTCKRAALTVEEIVQRAHRMHREAARRGLRLSLVVVDYLQLIRRPAGDRRNTADIIGDQTRALKLLAMGLDVPVILLSQLNREIEKREDKVPRMSDLKDSGSIEQDAATITFIDRPILYDPDADRGHADLYVAKNRYGRTGTARAIFNGPTVSFDSAPPEWISLVGGAR